MVTVVQCFVGLKFPFDGTRSERVHSFNGQTYSASLLTLREILSTEFSLGEFTCNYFVTIFQDASARHDKKEN